MHRAHTICILLLISGFLSCKAPDANVLFIGNSLTEVNNMPATVQRMIEERDLPLKIEVVAPGGWTCARHATFSDYTTLERVPAGDTAATVKKMLGRNWNAVVVQDAITQWLIPEQLKYCATPAIHFLDSIAKSKKARTILYQNYAYNHYPVRYSTPNGPNDSLFRLFGFDPAVEMILQPGGFTHSDSFTNRAQVFALLDRESTRLAAANHIELAPVGRYFEECQRRYPKIRLYAPDDAHPSREGSYLIACTIFRTLTGQHLQGITYSAGINRDVARKLRDIVDARP